MLHSVAFDDELGGGCSSAWLEPQIVDLVVAGSNPVSHPILGLQGLPTTVGPNKKKSRQPLAGQV